MIFYFSGTGNSLYTAKKIADSLSEETVDIASAYKNKEFNYSFDDDDYLGFVFPVYFYGVPSIVKDFAKKFTASGHPFIFSVITCGGSIAAADGMFEKALGLKINASYSVKMPDNYIPMYNVPSTLEAKERLEAADKNIDKIIPLLVKKQEKSISNNVKDRAQTLAMYAMYDPMRTTKKFYVTENCISCGKCATNCPVDAIQIKDGIPQWVSKKCVQCLACIHRCPTAAIQYGKSTEKRNRYVNPILK